MATISIALHVSLTTLVYTHRDQAETNQTRSDDQPAVYTQFLSYGKGNVTDLLGTFLFSNCQRATAARSDTK